MHLKQAYVLKALRQYHIVTMCMISMLYSEQTGGGSTSKRDEIIPYNANPFPKCPE